MNTNYVLRMKVWFGLKGQCILAQPSGLGLEDTPNLLALKGQGKGRFYAALSERFVETNTQGVALG